MKKATMMTAILGIAAISTASFIGCGLAASAFSAPQTDAPATASVFSETADDDQISIMDVIGIYKNGNMRMTVYTMAENEMDVTISLRSGKVETERWEMSGTVTQVGDTLVMNYQDCACEHFIYNEDGSLSDVVTEYTNGSGSITFNGSQAVWSDAQDANADNLVFSYN